MKKSQKMLAIDLLKALDYAVHGKLRTEAEYRFDVIISAKELLKATKYLRKLGYIKVEGLNNEQL